MKHWLEKGAALPESKRILILGDSISQDGTYVSMLAAYMRTYHPGCRLDILSLGLSSETVSGGSENTHPFPRPCLFERLDRILEAAATRPEGPPEWVVCCYGMNDGIYHPQSMERFAAFQDGIRRLVDRIHVFGAKVVLLTPPPFDTDCREPESLRPEGADDYGYDMAYGGYDRVLADYSGWILKEMDGAADLTVDIRTPLLQDRAAKRMGNPAYRSGDGVHPLADGHWVMARTLIRKLFNISVEREPAFVGHPERSKSWQDMRERDILFAGSWRERVGHTHPDKAIVPPFEDAMRILDEMETDIADHLALERVAEKDTKSDWKGYVRHDFHVNGFEAILIEPQTSAKAAGSPWVWRAEFFLDFNQADMALLAQGWHLAYFRISDLYGCPEAVARMATFHSHMVRFFGLSDKPSLFGFSRGGLYAVNFAAAYPKKVSSLYLDAPVLDIFVWPCGPGAQERWPVERRECMEVYSLREEQKDDASFMGNPLDKVAGLVNGDIPVILVAGDADEPVPFEKNGKLFETSYREHGGVIKTIVKPGIGHHPHSLEDPTPIVDFVKAYFRAE